MRKLWHLFSIIILAASLSGCAVERVAVKVASVVAEPVMGLVVKDADTTRRWIEQQVAAGNMDASTAEDAMRCPSAVTAIDDLRKRLSGEVEDVDGFRGLIYYGTLNRYTRDGAQDEAKRYLKQLADACLRLIPVDKLITIF